MVHTLPDYTSKWKTQTVTAIADNAELAARLKSIVTFDRRGNIIWMDDFEGAILLWETALSGTDAAIAISAASAHQGSTSCKLTAGKTATRYAIIRKDLAPVKESRFGLECCFTVEDKTHKMVLAISRWDGHDYWYGAIEIINFSD